MKCGEAQQKISKMMDDELTPTQKEDVDKHLDECKVCREYQERLLKVEEALGRIAEPELEEEASNRLFDHAVKSNEGGNVYSQNTGPDTFRRSVTWLSVAATFLLALGLVAQQWWIHTLRSDIESAEMISSRAGEGGIMAAEFNAETIMPAVDPSVQARAFREVSRYFDRRVNWLVEDGDQTELGLSSDSVQPATEQRRLQLALRLVHWRGEGRKRILSAPVVLIRPGVRASFALSSSDQPGAKDLHYVCRTGEDNRIEVRVATDDSRVKLGGTADLGSESTSLVGFTRTPTGAYALFVSQVERQENGGKKEEI